jgi:hypothetical protein
MATRSRPEGMPSTALAYTHTHTHTHTCFNANYLQQDLTPDPEGHNLVLGSAWLDG